MTSTVCFDKWIALGILVEIGRNDGLFATSIAISFPTHSYADVGLRQCCTVVDAVAHHRHHLALLLQLFDKLRFSSGCTLPL